MGLGAATARRRARLLVSGAAAAAVATAILLALLTAALVAGWGGGPAVGNGSAAFGAAGLAVGLLVLARAVAVTRTDPARSGAVHSLLGGNRQTVGPPNRSRPLVEAMAQQG